MNDEKIISLIKPQTGGSARSGIWVSMANYGKLTMIVSIAQGAANTTAITVDKAKTSAGGSNSDGITMANFWTMVDAAGTAQAAASDTYTKGTAAASITSSSTGSGCSVYVIEILAEELGDGYNWVQLELGSSSASNLVSAVGILTEPRYASSANPTALA